MAKGLWTEEFGQIGALLKQLQDHGVTTEHLAAIRRDVAMAAHVAKAITSYQPKASNGMNPDLARRFFGRNFWGQHEWNDRMDIIAAPEPEFPWGKDILLGPCSFQEALVRDTHFAFLGVGEPVDLTFWQERNYNILPKDWQQSLGKAVLKKTCSYGWHIMPVMPPTVPISTTYRELIQSMPENYTVASVIQEVTKAILFRNKNGQWPTDNGELWRWTDDTALNGRRLAVMVTDVGIRVMEMPENCQPVGLALARSLG